MQTTRLTALGATLLAALPLAATQPLFTQQRSAGDATPADPSDLLVPPATRTILIPAEHEQSLADLVKSLGDATGLRFVVSAPTRQLMNDSPAGILGGGEVPIDEVYTFVESVLSRHEIVMERLGGHVVPVVGLHALRTNDGSSISSWAQVAVEDMASWRQHEALLVQCLVDVSPMDARQVGNVMRQLLRNTNYQNVMTLGGESSLLLRGTGREVADLVDLLHAAAKNEAELYERREAEAKARMNQQQGAGGQGIGGQGGDR